MQAPDAPSSFRFVLLDKDGVTEKTGARLFTSRSELLAELRRQGEDTDGFDLGSEGSSPSRDESQDSEDQPLREAVVS
jgi:hypothetical protein